MKEDQGSVFLEVEKEEATGRAEQPKGKLDEIQREIVR